MTIVPSLLTAILRLDGEALVMHVGEKPYVVAPGGQVELATRALGFDAVAGMVAELLPPESLRALDEFGAVQYEFPPKAEFPGEQFTVVAARGGDDVWVEIRRRRLDDEFTVPRDMFEAPAADAPAPSVPEPSALPAAMPPAVVAVPTPDMLDTPPVDDQLVLPSPAELWASDRVEREADAVTTRPAAPFVVVGERRESRLRAVASLPPLEALTASDEGAEIDLSGEMGANDAGSAAPTGRDERYPYATFAGTVLPESPAEPVRPPTMAVVLSMPHVARMEPPAAPMEPEPAAAGDIDDGAARPGSAPVVVSADAPAVAPFAAERADDLRLVRAVDTSELALDDAPTRQAEPQPALPPAIAAAAMSARPLAAQESMHMHDADPELLPKLLRLAAGRGASALYLSSGASPMVRVDGEIHQLEGEAVLTVRDVESMIAAGRVGHTDQADGVDHEWSVDLGGIGRAFGLTFRDRRGPGLVVRMLPTSAITAEQLGLSAEIRALASESEGLVLVTGPRGNGKSTLVMALVDLINRTRRDHVVTIEPEIRVVHEPQCAFVSQREATTAGDAAVAARDALREGPDVLVIDDLLTPDLVAIALDAAASGRLVIAGLTAPGAAAALERVLEELTPSERQPMQRALAENLRGVVAQVLVRKPGGGRVPARELLLNTPAVSEAIASGRLQELAPAMDAGRACGMVQLEAALADLVQRGLVDGRDACRRANDRSGMVADLKRRGVDTSAIEWFA